MLGSLNRTNTDPVEAAWSRRKQEAKEARDEVSEAEAQVEKLCKELKAYEKSVEEVRAEVRTKPGHVRLAAYPTRKKAEERAAMGNRLQSDLRAAESKLRHAKITARNAEKRAAPLSPQAVARLRFLVEAVQADQELAEMGVDVSHLMSTPAGRNRLVAMVRDEFGVKVD